MLIRQVETTEYDKLVQFTIQDLPFYYDDCGLVNFMLYEYVL